MDIALLGISVKGLASSLFSFVLAQYESGVEAVVRDVIGKTISATTSTGLDGTSWFSGVAGAMFPIEELVVAPLLFAATIGAVLRQDMRRLARAWLVCLPLSMIAGFAVVKLAALGVSVTDALSSAIQAQVSPDLGSVFYKALVVGMLATVANGLLGVFLCTFFLFGALAIWMELAVRSACIELAVFFMPLAFAGLVWPATAHWAKRMVEVLASLLLAKPVIVGSLCLGARALGSLAGLSAAVEGATILLLATFAPMAVLKLVPMVETSAIGHLQGLSVGPLKARDNALRAVAYGSSLAAPAAVGEAATAGAATGAGGAPASGLGSALGGGVAHLLSQVGGRASRPEDDWDDGDPLGPARFPSGPGSGDGGANGAGRG